jgi:basic membrane protein A
MFAAKPLRIAMVTDIGGLGDKSFNDSAYEGLKLCEKKLGAKIMVVESKKMEDYVPNLKSLADQKYDMIWAIGFLMNDALKEVSKQYPDVKFGIIDSVVDNPNVLSTTFKEEEGSFLVGLVAGKDTKKNIVGFVGGMEFPLIKKFEAGFKAGAKAANPKVQVRSAYAGSFGDPAKGKELANAQFASGADIVYHAAGATGLGVIEAAKERGKGYWAIGVDQDQHHLAPANLKACMVKRVDIGVFNGVKALVDGKFKGGVVALGLKENGVSVCANTKKTASKAALKLIDKYTKLIIANKYEVPTDPAKVK